MVNSFKLLRPSAPGSEVASNSFSSPVNLSLVGQIHEKVGTGMAFNSMKEVIELDK